MRTALYLIALAMLTVANPSLRFDGFTGYVLGVAFGAGAVFAWLGDLAEYRWYVREGGRRP